MEVGQNLFFGKEDLSEAQDDSKPPLTGGTQPPIQLFSRPYRGLVSGVRLGQVKRGHFSGSCLMGRHSLFVSQLTVTRNDKVLTKVAPLLWPHMLNFSYFFNIQTLQRQHSAKFEVVYHCIYLDQPCKVLTDDLPRLLGISPCIFTFGALSRTTVFYLDLGLLDQSKKCPQATSRVGWGDHLVNFPSFRDCTAHSPMTESNCLINIFHVYGCLLQRYSIEYTYMPRNGSPVVLLHTDFFSFSSITCKENSFYYSSATRSYREFNNSLQKIMFKFHRVVRDMKCQHYLYDSVTALYSRNWHNIVNRLFFN